RLVAAARSLDRARCCCRAGWPRAQVEWSTDGQAIINQPDSLQTLVQNLTWGENEFVLTANHTVCPAVSDTIIITVQDVLIPTGFSPNNDGQNDAFEIRSIDKYDNISLQVFNRWGNEVYKNNTYNNDWLGNDHNGNQLPADTYYVVMLMDNEEYKGYVVLKR
ncbi:MAG: gliding motility-associated C-terminal domain-containing protein, partial [Bacteroidota bacterium]